MRAVLWTGIPYNVTVQDVPMPRIQSPTDALVRMTAAAICGTDLHVYHGIYGSSTPPWIMGHEGMGVVEEVGDGVQSLSVGDTVVIPDLLDTGSINMDLATDWDVGGIIGLGDDNGSPSGAQAEYLVVPFADNSLIPVPSSNTSNTGSTPEQISYLFLSDIFATGWTALTYSGFETGDTVAVFGAGPVGLLSAYSAILRGASRVYVVDSVPSRLDLAESIGAIPISLNGTADAGGPAAEILRREPNGVARSVDCVGYEAVNSNLERQENTIILDMVNVTSPYGGMGTIGVFAALDRSDGTPLAGNSTGMVEFPVADFFNKALSWRSGAVDPKAVAPELEELVTSGRAQLDFIVSSVIGIEEVPEFYARFDQHLETKVIITFD
ncbi:glutathione-independent formaldehyde dehydrogenase [Aspergillus stella-maris]|uniref:glutathione-independent formaldehyde dehydrogenase n=1 Tax=Aspergillus stella-maris TaxID=1810926 RepID=UPI003CCD7656